MTACTVCGTPTVTRAQAPWCPACEAWVLPSVPADGAASRRLVHRPGRGGPGLSPVHSPGPPPHDHKVNGDPTMSLLDTLTTTARVRPLLWLAEACVACGVEPAAMRWQPYIHWEYQIQVRSVGDVERLAAHLCLPERSTAGGMLLYARGAWLDEIRIEVFTGLPAAPESLWPTDVDSELLAANPDPVDDVTVDDLWIGYEGEAP